MKKRSNETKSAYKLYKKLFESIKWRSKQNYYFEKLLKFRYNSKKKKKKLKEKIIVSDEKTEFESYIKVTKQSSKLTINKVDVIDETKIAHELNSFFTNIRKNLASKIPNAPALFEYFANESYFSMEIKPLSMNELKDAFHSSKSNKRPDYDSISCSVT